MKLSFYGLNVKDERQLNYAIGS